MKIFFLSICFLFSLHSYAQKSQKEMFLEQLIRKSWQMDSCGTGGIRKEISYFFSSTKYLNGKSLKFLNSLLGQPESQIQNKEEIILGYTILCYQDEKGNCIRTDRLEIGSMNVFYNKRTKKVTGIVLGIE